MNNKIEIYQASDNQIQVQVLIEQETVWLNRQQMAVLFDRDIKTIGKHIANIFSEGELDSGSVVANFATTASDGKTYQVEYYNLDVIISVGYRVKSRQGTQFRQWATSRLKDYLVEGYAINRKHLEEKAAMLLYLIVKNHSFIDGNKRIAAACFLYFLRQNNLLYDRSGEAAISSEALAAITLFIAVSKPEEIETVKKVIISILNRRGTK